MKNIIKAAKRYAESAMRQMGHAATNAESFGNDADLAPGMASAFTLVELLIGMVISLIAMSSLYGTHVCQQKAAMVQEEIVGVQQNIRVAMYHMEREFRMAGCDPTGSAGAGIVTAGSNSIAFTSDITGGEGDGIDNDNDGSIDEADEAGFSDGACNDSNEDITYGLFTDTDGIQKLGRKSPSTAAYLPIAENIDALNFVYLNASGGVAATISDIRSIQITLVARANRADNGYTDTSQYLNQQGTSIMPIPNDNFRRKLLTTEVRCRNLGL